MNVNGETGAPHTRSMKRPVIALVVVLFVIAGAGAGIGLSTGSSKSHHATAIKGPTYPKKWDPRIAPLAAIASKYRGLKFIHPVFVEFLTSKQFDKQVTTNGSDFNTGQKQQEANQEGTLRALGFVSGGVDQLKQSNQLNSSGILAFYNNADKRIRVRGTRLTPDIKVTLVHELTHALQDQHFDLSATFKKIDASDTEDDFAYDALVEGDAVRIQDDYQSSLPKRIQKALDRTSNSEYAQTVKQTKSVPGFFITDSQTPYVLGPQIITQIFKQGGNAAVNKLFRNPPVHEIQLMQPWVLGQTWTTHAFSKPVLAKGDKSFGRGEFGAYYLYLLLSQRLPINQALAAADSWDGDQEMNYTHNGKACIAIAFTGNTNQGTERIYSGLRQWARGIGTSASVSLAGGTVQTRSCDPGKRFKAPKDHTADALDFLALRNSLVADYQKQGISLSLAACYAVGLSHAFTPQVMTQATISDAQRQEVASIGAACRNNGGL